MKLISTIRAVLQHEDVNFLLTNRVPRHFLTRAVGWFSRIRSPLLARVSISIWKLFTDLDLAEAESSDFPSLHACFTRALRPGARPVDTDPSTVTSPSDGIVGECGLIRDGCLLQAKGMQYRLAELIASEPEAERFIGGCFVTLRLTSAMYHRFHAPVDMHVDRVDYISGDTWNVNPIALRRIERLFCRNERAVIHGTVAGTGARIALVPVAAILVASIRLHFANVLLHLKYRGPNHIVCDHDAVRGQELGWFEHGSTIIVLAPRGFTIREEIQLGKCIRMGLPLMRTPPESSAPRIERH